jgi:O6-methylguanine-DNA--protein-cysteine methyltransferase
MNPHQASFILDKALAERKLTHHDVRRYTTQLQHEITELEVKIAALRSTQNGNEPSQNRKAAKPVSRQVAASRKLQGRYLALIRQVPASQRGKYQRIAKRDGREAAIAAMKKR